MHHIGCPSVIRGDYGTENPTIAAIQIAFRFYHIDGMANEKSFIYGPSKSNIVGVQKYMKLFHLNYYYNPFTENRGMVVSA